MIQNAIYLPKLDKYYVSSHRHDYVQFTLDGSDPVTSPVPSSTFFIDGGRDYRRSNFISHPEIIDFTLADDASDDEIYNKLLWGNKGKSGKEPTKYLLLKDLTIDHLQAILATQHQIDSIVRKVIVRAILEKNNAKIR